MNATLSPRVAVLLLLVIATVFGSNHVAARIAFDHGASVATAVFARSAVIAVVLLVLLRLLGVPMALPRPTLLRGLFIGLLVALQSFCIYSAVARIPAALALLAFNTFPLLFALASWAFDGARPSGRALVAMPLALVGLVLALDLVGKLETVTGRWQEIGVGVLFGLGAAVSFAMVLYLTGRWLKEVDGRVRAFVTVSVTALVALAAAWPSDAFALPYDATGWTALVLVTVFYGTAITALFIVQPLPGVSRYTAAMNFEPIAVMFMGWAILEQSVKPLQILGAFIVIGAVILLTSRK
ncbi:MAG: DMT family transporter [Betaproteobacteria bacterium]|nr:DMT family transporter [Betaproteobacteria bacterium]